MKTTPLLILLTLCGLLVYFAFQRNSEEWQESSNGYILPEDFPTEQICAVEIQGREFTTTLLKQEGNRWCLKERDGYFASKSQLWQFIVILTQVRMAEPLDLTQESMTQAGLDEDHAVKVILRNAENSELATIYFGKKSELNQAALNSEAGEYGEEKVPVGRYVRSGDRAALVPYTFALLEDSPSEWLDREFFQIQRMKSCLCVENGVEQWQLSRADEKSSLQLSGEIPMGFQADSSRLMGIQNAFGWISFEDVKKGALEKCVRELKIEDFDGLQYVVRLGETSNGMREMSVSIEHSESCSPEGLQLAEKWNGRFAGWRFWVQERYLSAVLCSREELLTELPGQKD